LKLRPQARFLIVNRNEHDYIRAQLTAGGVPLELVEIRAASHAEVPVQMARMDAGVFFYKPCFSRAACAPTKLGEFLGCGILCLANRGVGDMAEILEGEAVGIALDDFSPESLRVGVERLLDLVAEPEVEQRCTAVARRYFSLDEGVRAYGAIYQELLGSPS